jgi:phosphoribosylformimino-5-aminoimidazole carboxamide ribotide isomerase
VDVLAAIDLRGGQAVRLLQGRYEDETTYGDPLVLAQAFIDQGASWLHLVDLDAARDGGQANRSIIKEIAAMSHIPIETGGGVRRVADVAQLVEAGVRRVIVGTAALMDPDEFAAMVAVFPDYVAVGLDYRIKGAMREVAVRGWLEGAGRDLIDVLHQVEQAGATAIISTAIDRDGTLQGPDLDGLRAAMDAASIPVIASGGVGSLSDLVALREAGCPGVVVGKALVEGAFSVGEAAAICK